MAVWKHRSSDRLQAEAAALIDKGDLRAAALIWQHLLERHPGHPQPLETLGTLRGLLGDYAAAVRLLAKAAQLNPRSYGAHYNLGLAYSKLGRLDEAIAALGRAVEIAPDMANAYGELGRAQEARQDYAAALASFKKGAALAPASPWLSEIVHCRQQVCDWDGLEAQQRRLTDRLLSSGEPIQALLALHFVDDPQLLRRNAEAYFLQHFALPPPEPLSPQRTPSQRRQNASGKLRVGYMSGDFCAHPTSHLIVELIERHDRSRFEIVAFSVGSDDKSPIRTRLKSAFDKFVDCSGRTPAEIAAAVRKHGIDILIDLSGYIDKSQIKALAYRPAPVQVHYLGFPSTLACPWVDYLLVDPFVVPPGSEQHYTEALCYLPNTYQVSSHRPSSPPPSRVSQGLPEDAFVFASFNNQLKIQPHVFELWLDIMRRTPGSVLWLYARNDLALSNLCAFAASRGIGDDRIVPVRKVPNDQHIARQALADLMLDTFPYTGHTTTSDALWAGVPVVTYAGRSFASRVSGSLLRAHGMQDLITTSLSRYADLAVEIARTPGMADALKRRVAANRDSHPLFDTTQFCRDFETALLTMWQRWERGEAPSRLDVPPSGAADRVG